MTSRLELVERAANGDMAPDVQRWLSDGFKAHLHGEELNTALGLDAVSRKREVYRLIADLGVLLGGDGCAAWPLAGRVEAAISRFELRVLPRLRAGQARLTGPSDVVLARLFRSGVLFPREQRQIYEKVLRK